MGHIERAEGEDMPTVCIAHGCFIPCRKDGEHRYTDNPYWVKSVRDYQGSPIDGLTWEPAWAGEQQEAPPPCQTGSDGASRPERGQP